MKDAPSSNPVPRKQPYTPIVKWYNTTWTYEQKYKCGRLTYEEYLQWMEELRAEEEEKNAGSVQTGATAGTTFWQQDDVARENLSNDAYADFLAQNSIDVSTNATVDIERLLAEAGGNDSSPESAPPPDNDVDVNEILKSVNASMHGDDILSEEEIAALFAAANAGENIC